jgi:Cu(I)/Ag(I) efflux system membrane protein CusA/SilA
MMSSINLVITLLVVSFFLSAEWLPLGPESSAFINFIFVLLLIGTTLGLLKLFIRVYPTLLNWCLENRLIFAIIPCFIVLFGSIIWLGFDRVFGFIPKTFGDQVRTSKVYSSLYHSLPGIGKEFMPALDEGSFLLMPTSMAHAGIQQNREILRYLDMAVTAIPEVEMVVGKLGRIESALDPAPISMYENVINYKSEYKTDQNGRRVRFRYRNGDFVRDEKGQLIEDDRGSIF